MSGNVAHDDSTQKEPIGNYDQRVEVVRQRDFIDAKYGYKIYTDADKRLGWLINVQQSELVDESLRTICSAVDLYFIEDDGSRFKITYPFRPYLYLATTVENELFVASYLSQRFNFIRIDHVEKIDLDLKNHLSGLKSRYIRVTFPSTSEMGQFKKELMPQIRKNMEKVKKISDYTTILAEHMGSSKAMYDSDPKEQIIDIREHDIPFETRVCIDNKLFVGLWYDVTGRDKSTNSPIITKNDQVIEPPDPTVCAFDIETTKLPLKFPDSAIDQIMMISYMIDGVGFLIINREIVAKDIQNFEYTPKSEFKGEFFVFNEPNEKALIIRFFDHIVRVKPSIMVTYNGDFFDWPFVDARSSFHQISMRSRIGFFQDAQGEYRHNNCVHMDAFKWVQRDSYLPMGSQNLKAATRAKLCYDPIELNPEEMLKMARENPEVLANYSVSDAVATYYLYMKYVHPFIFALCTIIPLSPDDVLRKGSGTLCEALLMVQAFHGNIIFPNKQIVKDNLFSGDGHLIESETYVGGHVEALESGVFRSDIPCKFRLDIDALTQLRSDVRATLTHSLTKEMKFDLTQISNFDEVCTLIEEQLELLIKTPVRNECPRIYHLDVGAMYPNIILTNRLQPPATVTEEDCMACIYNTPDATCKRRMKWTWRGELIPATRGEYERLMQQLKQEKFGKPPAPFYKLPREESSKIEKKRINDYCRRAYGKLHITREEERTTTICQRENAFYVNTVLAFRDRRYEYKALHKKAKVFADSIPPEDLAGLKVAQSRVVLYDSLQLAHKCILNSFYGYVMRKGSRWFSMEMAGIVCLTGAKIITEARQLIERVGRPLELDTDGIWCLLPSSFPEIFEIRLNNGKTVTISYPGAVLNTLVQIKFTNDQYHTLQPDSSYTITSENSIFFEVDGPYHAMILPASKEEGKKLKKRYAVFNFDGSLAELKGFEIKRRGELAIIKHFQSTVFKSFLKGTTLSEIYDNVAREANYWLDILFDKAGTMSTKDLFELIAEDKSMSRKLEDYGSQKSTSITTAKRLAQFLGESMIKDKGLACRFIVSKFPLDAAVTERTIPTAIFETEPAIRNRFLREWTKSHQINFSSELFIRELIDWQYYIDRLGSSIQKIITIPAALQGIPNPVPRLPHPVWLESRRLKHVEMHLQPKINEIFKNNVASLASNTVTTPSRKRQRSPLIELGLNDFDDDVCVLESSPRILDDDDNDVIALADKLRHTKSQRTTIKRKKIPDQKRRLDPEHYTSNGLHKKTWSNHGFSTWIEFLKVKWLRQKLARQGTISSRNCMPSQGVVDASFSSRNPNVWHILQILETKIPGQYTVFTVINNVMRRFNLGVPRTIYVDDIKERVTNVGVLVQKTLPKMVPCSNLYEYSLDELQFFCRLVELNTEMCMMRINGIYETKVPLMFKSFIKMGSTCHIPQRNSTEISFNQITRMSMFEADYIELDQIRLLYVYEFAQLQSGRSVLALFIPSHHCGCIIIVNRVRVEVGDLNSLYKLELDKFVKKKGSNVLDKRCYSVSTQLVQCTTQKDAVRQMHTFINSLKFSVTDPCLVCLQTNRSSNDFFKEFSIFGGFPYVPINVPEPANVMNMLDWQNVVAKRAIQHFFISFVYIKDYWVIANYLGIPIGNIPDDISTLGLDLFFARQLYSSNYLLWASPTVQPDFGGKELEDWRLGNNWETVSFEANTGYIINKETLEAENIVVELNLGAVAMTALLQSSRIAEAEGTSELVGFVSDAVTMSIEDALSHRFCLSNYDEGIAVSGVLRVLKEVFHELVHDIHVNKNVLADQLVMNMHRWILNKNSLMYHPGISSAISIYMRKLCLLLVSEINRLGGDVIFCSFTKIVLSTKKKTLPLANAFVSSLISSLVQKPVFASLQLYPSNFSKFLIWIDQTNFALVNCDAEKDGKMTLKFSMADRLPEHKGCKSLFFKTIAGYIALISKFLWTSLNPDENQSKEEQFESYCVKLLMDDVAPSLFRVTTMLVEVRKQLNSYSKSIGMSDDVNSDVPLEFVNSICRILSVNQYIVDDVDQLRNQLFLILQTNSACPLVPDQPNQSFLNIIIEHIFCKKCSQITDLHLNPLSDAALETDIDPSKQSKFFCSGCKNVFAPSLIEEMLIERISKIHLSFVLQDWQCKECKKIGARYLAHLCECNKPYGVTVSSEQFNRNLRAILYIAKRYALTNLGYFIEQILASYCS